MDAGVFEPCYRYDEAGCIALIHAAAGAEPIVLALQSFCWSEVDYLMPCIARSRTSSIGRLLQAVVCCRKRTLTATMEV